jgi:hypothetical protein
LTSATAPSGATVYDDQLRAKVSQEQVALAAAREAASAVASAPVHAGAASSVVPSRAPGPREICAASKSSNAEECLRRVCKSEPRFKRLETCVRLQRQPQPQPWWKIFKPG